MAFFVITKSKVARKYWIPGNGISSNVNGTQPKTWYKFDCGLVECDKGSVEFDMCPEECCVWFFVFCSGKGQEADKFLSAAPSSPLRKQEIENLR